MQDKQSTGHYEKSSSLDNNPLPLRGKPKAGQVKQTALLVGETKCQAMGPGDYQEVSRVNSSYPVPG